MAVEDVFRRAAMLCASPAELQVKVYDWAEYVRSPEDDDADKKKPQVQHGSHVPGAVRQAVLRPCMDHGPATVPGPQAQQIFGSLLADAELGFPVPCYPHCLQEADRYAQVVDLDLAILQTRWRRPSGSRSARTGGMSSTRSGCAPADPAAGRYQ